MKACRQILERSMVVSFLLAVLGIIAAGPSRAIAQVTETVAVDGDQVLALSFAPDSTLLAGGGMEKKVRLWDLRTNQLRHTLEGPGATVRSVAFSPDSKTVAAGSDDQAIYLWDAATGKLRQTLKGHSGMLTSVAYAPDGKTLAGGSVRQADDKGERRTCEVKLWDPATGRVRQTLLRQDGMVAGVAFSPDGQTLAVALAGVSPARGFCGIRLWDVVTGKQKQSLAMEAGFPLAVTFSPDGKVLASGGGYAVATDGGTRPVGEVKLWDVAAGKLLRTLMGQDSGYFRSVAFSPDGRAVASGSSGPVRDYQIGNTRGQKLTSETKLWDVATGRLLWNAEGDLGDVHAVALSPDGTTLASCDGERLKLSDARSGMTRQVLMVMTWKPFPKGKQ